VATTPEALAVERMGEPAEAERMASGRADAQRHPVESVAGGPQMAWAGAEGMPWTFRESGAEAA
jgi:hypothetical protein